MANRVALIEFFYTVDTLYTFLVRGEDANLGINDQIPIVHAISISDEKLQKIVDDFSLHFEKISSNDDNLDQVNKYLEQVNMDSFYQLGQQIFSTEFLELIKSYEILYLVPYGVLHYFPMHAFRLSAKDYLIDKFAVSYLPSASLLKFFKPPTLLSENSILLAGKDSTGNSHLFIQEINQIKGLPFWSESNKTVLTQRTCTKLDVLSNCRNKRVIHLSAHGHYVSTDPMLSGLSFYGEYSDQFKDEGILEQRDYKYLLSAQDIYDNAKLEAELLVLSACISASNKRKEGEELIGLSRSIFAAGVQSMILSLFPVAKGYTAHPNIPELQFAHFYRLWLAEGYSKVFAFQQFIQGIKRNKNYEHPYFWCAFQYVGSIY